jgi:thiol-disulfide isomerase/thioredoxin
MNKFFVFLSLLLLGLVYQCKTASTYHSYIVNGEYIMDGRAKQKDFVGNPKCKWFDSSYAAYKTNQSFVNSLKPMSTEIKVVVVAGSWCEDTQRELPHFYKVMNEVGVSENQIELIMVDRKKQSSAFNASALDVKNIPAIIFYKDGKEQGRIVEAAIGGTEEAMMNIFKMM